MPSDIYDLDLPKNPANYRPLTPLTFLERAADVYPDHIAIIHGALRRTYRDFHARSKKLASALALIFRIIIINHKRLGFTGLKRSLHNF